MEEIEGSGSTQTKEMNPNKKEKRHEGTYRLLTAAEGGRGRAKKIHLGSLRGGKNLQRVPRPMNLAKKRRKVALRDK